MGSGIANRAKLNDIRARYLRGDVTIDEAKLEAKPIIDDMNIKGKEIAKKHGKKFFPFTYGYLMR